jgi:PAS domain-containing protein
MLGNRGATLTHDDESLLQALAAHAAVALENSRLFNKIAQASRHWHDIFDAISDLIVVHDDGNRVLRVNRSMAELIGAPPPELIGRNMGALISGLLYERRRRLDARGSRARARPSARFHGSARR